MIEFMVVGTPAPQGSKRHVGKGVMVESSKKVKPWREAVKWAAWDHMKESGAGRLLGPVGLDLVFSMPRPKKPKFAFPAVAPDASKLARSTEDALTEAGVYEDDARIVHLSVSKVFAGTPGGLDVPGATIRIWSLA